MDMVIFETLQPEQRLELQNCGEKITATRITCRHCKDIVCCPWVVSSTHWVRSNKLCLRHGWCHNVAWGWVKTNFSCGVLDFQYSGACYCHLLCMLRTNGPQFGLQAHLSLDNINSYRPIQYKCENDWYVKLGGWSINVVLKIRPRYMYRRHVVLKVSRVNEPKMFS